MSKETFCTTTLFWAGSLQIAFARVRPGEEACGGMKGCMRARRVGVC